jgi:hypothetical protein
LVRRGLSGELLYAASDFFNLDLIWMTAVFQSVVLSLIFYFVLSLYLRSPRTHTELAILVSPAFLLFPYHDYSGGFRKEILVFLTFVIFLHFLVRRKLTALDSTLVLLLFAFSAFSYEASAFLLPFFLLASFMFYKTNVISKKYLVYLSIFFSLIAFLSLLFSLFFLGIGKSGAICKSLLAHGLNQSICSGAIDWLENNSAYGLMKVSENIVAYNYIYVYGMSIILASIPFLFLNYSKFNRWGVLGFFMASIILILPLFFVAIDWGRWVHIYFFFLSTLVFSLITLDHLSVKINFHFALVVVYGTLWNIPNCCRDHIGGALGQIGKSIGHLIGGS